METITEAVVATNHSAAAEMEEHAAAAAAMLRLLASERRLMVLCTLIAEGEAPVGRLATRAGLSQPAMSQHLAKLREDGLVATRRNGTTIFYRIADPRVARIMATLHEVFCGAED
ncbi:DNA-binding transcriptional ArsR family regulator [Roseomonas alkaliterrae]|jgi:DNA-binding transcriptional ArsR family regulator|uniref:DNA-binding transcriptional ArsR family regulator n=1 Tax=Neoroseomonas alkaliterrae TaxID=1452450 RepID=A0A840XMP2_9PROT|nr:metalloregulator ArsR/SmtB family transcription factor [Neoroseomonas alkaliterrae]MBB5687999.1 DNA-binding transcriptional ArsR family regulator [Neoroseomonas alkaliterrae]